MVVDLGTALGIVSMAISVYDGVTGYCRAIKYWKEDVKSPQAISTDLKNILLGVQLWLGKRPTLINSMMDKVNDSVTTCLAQIDEVLKICTSHSPPDIDSLKSRLVYVKRGLQFPLKKDAIQALNNKMESLRENVKLAVTILASDFASEDFVALQKLIRQSEQQTSQSITDRIDEAEKSTGQSMKRYFDQTEQKITDRIQRSDHLVASDIASFEKSISTQVRQDTLTVTDSLTKNLDQNFTYLAQSTSSHMQQIEQTVVQTRLSLSSDFIDGQQFIVNELQEIKQLLLTGSNSTSSQHPAGLVLRSESIQSLNRRRSKRSAPGSQISELCTCNASITKCFFPSNSRQWFTKTSDTCLIHDKNCPLWYTSQRKTSVRVNIHLFRLYISGFVKFQSGYYRWRGWSSSPSSNLRCHITVPSDSGAFAILKKLRKTLNKSYGKPDWISRREHALSQCITSLHQAFSSGIASPHDVDEDGNNMLHILANPYYGRKRLPLNPIETISFIKRIQSFWNVDMYGINSVGSIFKKARTPIGFLFQRTTLFRCDVQDVLEKGNEFHCFLDWVIDSGFDIAQLFDQPESRHENPWEDLRRTPVAKHPYLLFPINSLEFMEDAVAGCNSLSIVVLQRDESHLREILKSSSNTLAEVNFLGQTALHLATAWIDGLKILLASGYITSDILNQQENCGFSALDYALFQRNINSVEVLLEAGSCFRLDLLNNIDSSCRKLLILSLSERRRQLKDLAVELKDSKESKHMEPFGSFTSDSASRMHLRLIDEAEISIPESLRFSVLPTGSVFTLYPNSLFSQVMFSQSEEHIISDLIAAGFVHVDESWDGLTPLMTLEFKQNIIRIGEILVKNGADPNYEFPMDCQNIQLPDDGRRHRAIHKLAFHIGMNHPGVMISELSAAPCLQRVIFQNFVHDPCSCYCSPGECRPNLALPSFDRGSRADSRIEFIKFYIADGFRYQSLCKSKGKGNTATSQVAEVSFI